MQTISYLFLAVFLVWSLSVVREDLASQKIPNDKIALGFKMLGAAVLLLAVMTFLGYKGRIPVFQTWNFYPLWCAHMFWSVLASMILWYSEVWPAGDAKFFMVIAGALPLINPQMRNFPHYLFLMLLINIFLSAAFFAVGSFIASGFAKASPSDFFSEMFADLKKRFSSLGGVRSAAYALNLAALFLLQQLLNIESRGFLSRLFSRVDVLYFFLFFLWDKVSSAFGSRRWAFVSAAFYALYLGAGLLFFRARLLTMTLAAASNVLRFGLLLIFGRLIFEFLLEKKDAVYLSDEEIVPGVILSTKETSILRKNPVFNGAFDDCFRDGLSAEQADLLRDWLKKMPVQSPKVETVRGRPFALWIFIGAVISLVLNRNLAGLLK
ncbi:MAG: hypothetical protein NTX59_08110 [Elusimicrobia bacterium]|nr:hypothetical protein [Elusimicrobiota bacterium]